jgi:hypothetical protein
MNSPLVARQAEALVSRLGPEGESEADAIARIQRAYRTLFQRSPSELEMQRGLAFLQKAKAEFNMVASAPATTKSSQSPTRRRRAAADEDEEEESTSKITPWQAYAQALLCSGEFIYLN